MPPSKNLKGNPKVQKSSDFVSHWTYNVKSWFQLVGDMPVLLVPISIGYAAGNYFTNRPLLQPSIPSVIGIGVGFAAPFALIAYSFSGYRN